jgi:hypothetical protein
LNKGLSQSKIDLVNAFLEVFITTSVVQDDIVYCQAFLLAGDEINVSLQREMIFGGHNPITKEKLQNSRRKLFGNLAPILKRMKKEYDTYLVFITDGSLDFKTIPTTSPHVSTFTTLVAVGCQVTLHKYSTFDELIYASNYEEMVIKMPEIENVFYKKCYQHQLHQSLMPYFPDNTISPLKSTPQKENKAIDKPKTSTPKSRNKSQPYFKLNNKNNLNSSRNISLFLEPLGTPEKVNNRYANLQKLSLSQTSNLLEYERYSCTLDKLLSSIEDIQKKIDDKQDEYKAPFDDRISEAYESEETDKKSNLEFLTFARSGQ